MAILVTGGSGFIGSHVCDRLLSIGETVVNIDNMNDFYSPKTKEKNIENNLKNKNYFFHQADITNKTYLEAVFNKHRIDKIIHLAARAGVRPSIQNPDIYYKTNIDGTVNVLEAARKWKVSNFVFGSSSSVYGNNPKTPFSETDSVDKPISPYAATKKCGELLCHTYHHLFNLNIVCLRFFTVYGPRGRPDMAPYIFSKSILTGKSIKKYGDGTTKRDYTFVSDIVDGIVSASEKELGYEIINLGNSNPIELNRFIQIIENLTGKKALIEEEPIPQGDVNLTYADISKAGRLLGYKPKVKIEEGMGLFIGWLKSNPENINF